MVVLDVIAAKMGSSVSIHNNTEVKLNIALSQVGPLYYQNYVLPGDCATFHVGKVWFTIEGRVWNGDNEYNGIQVAQPIIDATLEAVIRFMIVLGIVRNPSITFGRVGEEFTKAMGRAKFAHETDTTNKLLSRLFDGTAIHSPGWYFGNDRHISISGGPKYSSVVGDNENVEFDTIDVGTLNNRFIIEELEC